MTQIRKNHLVFSLYLLMCISTLLVFCCNLFRSQGNQNSMWETPSTSFSDGWTDNAGNAVVLCELNAAQTHPVGQPFSLYKQLPTEMERDLTLMFRSTSLCFTLSVEDIVLYTYGTEEVHVFGNSPGSNIHQVVIPKEFAGEQLCLNCTTSYNATYERFTNVILGDGTDILQTTIKANLHAFIICILLLAIGLLFLLIDIPICRIVNHNHSLLYLGIFAIAVSLWSLMETRIPDLLSNSAQATNCLSLMLLSLVSIPGGLFLCNTFSVKHRRPLFIGYALSVISYTLCLALYLSGIADFNQTLLIAQFVIAYFVLISCYTLFDNFRNKQCIGIEKKLIVVGLAQLLVGVTIDLIVSKISSRMDNSRFTRVAMVIFILCFGMVVCLQTMQRLKKVGQLEFVSQLAYKDGLTGIGNRTAFNEHIETCATLRKESVQLSIVMFDVNNLKIANDRFGHQQGDILIQGASSVIQTAFASLGRVYRIGGDEFATIITGNTKQDAIDRAFSTLEEQIEQFNRSENNPVPLSIAYGYACSQTIPDTIESLIQTADARMYAHKRKMKCDVPVR